MSHGRRGKYLQTVHKFWFIIKAIHLYLKTRKKITTWFVLPKFLDSTALFTQICLVQAWDMGYSTLLSCKTRWSLVEGKPQMRGGFQPLQCVRKDDQWASTLHHLHVCQWNKGKEVHFPSLNMHCTSLEVSKTN